MKKGYVIAFVLGLVFATALALIPSEWLSVKGLSTAAFRQQNNSDVYNSPVYRYHQMMRRKNGSDNIERRYTRRTLSARYSTKYPERPAGQTRFSGAEHKQLVPNLRYSQSNTRDAIKTETQEVHAKPSRVFSQKIGKWDQSLRAGRVVLKRINQARGVFQTFQNEAFSLQVPRGIEIKTWQDGEHLLESRNGELKIHINRHENQCGSYGFFICALNLSRNENHATTLDKILSTSRVIRSAGTADTVLHDIEKQTRVFTESFTTRIGNEDFYIARYFVEGTDGYVYMVETRNPADKSRVYLDVIKKVFDSFRLYGEEQEQD